MVGFIIGSVIGVRVGDIIRRKDMPVLIERIVAESDEWGGIWYVEPLWRSSFLEDRKRSAKRRKEHIIGFIFKDDDRWEITPKDELPDKLKHP